MGNGAGCMGAPEQKKEVVRRPPLTLASEVLGSEEARQRITYALSHVPPGTGFRWNKLLLALNRSIEPTEEEPDPQRVNLSMEEFMTTLNKYYDQSSPFTEGVSIMRDVIPKIYDKHSVERGRRISQRERNSKGLTDECYSYGEVDMETFAAIYTKTAKAYGIYPDGIFYDLGCGVGNLVFVAALMGNFTKCIGVDNLESLLERGMKRVRRWDNFKVNFPKSQRETIIDFIQDDFIEAIFWTDATFIFVHWSAFSFDQRSSIAATMSRCKEGTFVISLTHPVPNPDFQILKEDKCGTSWGAVDFFVQEKLTMSRAT